MLPHLLLAAAIVLGIYSQLTMKSRALVHSSVSNSSAEYLHYLFSVATDWKVASAAGATLLAGVCWLLAIQRRPNFLVSGWCWPASSSALWRGECRVPG